MNNKYFKCVEDFRLHRGNIINRYITYYKLKKYLSKVSPTYNDMLDMVKFIIILEFGFLYPNDFNCEINSTKVKCPLVVEDISKKVSISMIINNNKVRITLCNDEIKLINIKIYCSSNNEKKIRSEYTFTEGEQLKFNEAIGEEHLFITIINTLTKSIQQLLYLYCFKIK